MNWWQRIQEIEETAREGGFTLAMPAEQICQIEDEGSMVDLETGQIIDEVEESPTTEQPRGWWPFG